MHQSIEKALESIRPILQEDGGDIALEGVSEEGIVTVRLLGRCTHCPNADQTLKNIVAKTLMKTVAGVRRVEAVS